MIPPNFLRSSAVLPPTGPSAPVNSPPGGRWGWKGERGRKREKEGERGVKSCKHKLREEGRGGEGRGERSKVKHNSSNQQHTGWDSVEGKACVV